MSSVSSLDSLIRRADEDRWLASRFAAPRARAQLIAIYAVNYEISRTAEVAREPGVGAIRLAWWRDALADVAAGRPERGHPALRALTESGAPASALEALQTVAEAHVADFEAAPLADWKAVQAYVDATAGGVLRAALATCGAPDAEHVARVAGQAWGLAGLARVAAHWRARGRTGWTQSDLLEGAAQSYAEARVLAGQLPSAAFPAIGYLATLPGYLGALRKGRVATSPLARRFTLITASATGRI